MAVTSSLQLSNRFLIGGNYGHTKQNKTHLSQCMARKGQLPLISSNDLVRDAWSLYVQSRIRERRGPSSKCNVFKCQAVFLPNGGNGVPVMKKAALIMSRTFISASGNAVLLKLGPALVVIVFAAWGLRPLIRMMRNSFLHKNDSSWNKSSTHYITSYVQPLLIWIGTMLICRALEPVILPTEASDAVKKRLLNFVRSLSTVMAFGYCTSSLIQQMRKFLMETGDSNDARNMGFDFASKAVYTAVWVAAVSLFMELLGFSTQKWLTAGGLGTVLLTLAGREIFTNFLSSVMIHTTRPFVLNEWIQTKIEGYEVSGTVEHVGWWSPTIIRGDDREAVHIPNHKFTVSVVRNLSQKSHWRIKTHFAISHSDVNKIGNIVADMRKVLSKNPQVEQQRLHRRVFLDNVDQESQALRILVSCFVKTSHFEEYLCVKEAVILDLLRVIRHHGARLATPIRTIQRVYTGADTDATRAQDLINRPLLLIDSSHRVTSQNKNKTPKQEDEKTDMPSSKDLEEEDLALPRPSSTLSTPKQEGEKTDVPSPSTPARPVLEDNIVLGVALEGSKRTLPIEEMGPPENIDMESMEQLVGKSNGSGAGSTSVIQEKKNSEQRMSPGVNQSDNQEKYK